MSGQHGMVVWLTGLPCAGKSSIAERLAGPACMLLDGDILRGGLCADLGFSDTDREENLRRAAHVAAMLADAGVVVLCAFISPLQSQRDMVKQIVGADRFKLVYVKCPAAQCQARDVKGMWAKAIAGEIAGFTGFSAPYEEPVDPDLVIDTSSEPVKESAGKVLQLIRHRLAELTIGSGI